MSIKSGIIGRTMKHVDSSFFFFFYVLILFVQDCDTQNVPRIMPDPRSREFALAPGIAPSALPGRPSRAPSGQRMLPARAPVSRAVIPMRFRQAMAGMSMAGQRMPMPTRSRDPRIPMTRPGRLVPRQGRTTLIRRPSIRPPSRGPGLVRRTMRQRRNNIIPINPRPCDRSRVNVCRQVPRGQMLRGQSFCYRNCRQRNCAVPCICACVSRRGSRSDPRANPMSRFRRPSGNQRSVRLRNTLRMRQNLRPGLRNRLLQSGNRTRDRSLTFGLSDSVLASVLANPDVSMLVGPQGINDILAGVPPPIINSRNRTGLTMPGQVGTLQGNQLTSQPNRPSPMGIPIPITAVQDQASNDLMLASLLASSGDLADMAGLKMKSNVPSVRAAPAPALDLVMPSATIDNSIQIQPTSGNTGQANRTTLANTTALFANDNKRPDLSTNMTSSTSLQNWNPSDLRQFLAGAVKSTDPRMKGPSKDECLARRKELWCDPVGVWGETPGVARWCILNCRADKCDPKRCSCQCIDEVLFKQKYEQLRLKAP